MVIYEVNLDVDREIEQVYADWLGEHIQQMLGFAGFVEAVWYEREDDSDSQRVAWTVHYQVTGMPELQSYLQQHAARMRAHGVERFGGGFQASRRILHSLRRFA